ncbi:MAG: hypothetical protein Hyperionvirus52_4 [Hyperionvirus sp.]|uniref:Leucine-rich repeat protein n=1 Tax=Hyperionvirus sp. TaxID=2487770 RepID=A0A3G5AG87_9VIRU|nr:MAG: hypothetical protein Hyperionvirus52_4 [Hyperionvirus sp.]
MDRIYLIPFYNLEKYLEIKTLITLAMVSKYIRKEVFTKTRSFEITVVHQYASKYFNNFKNVKFHIDEPYNFNDDNFPDMHKIISLDVSYSKSISNNAVKNLINLQRLVLDGNILITDDGIKSLINIQALELYGNRKITDNGL